MERINANNDAQISLDFLIGITIFLLVFLFVLAFVPRMFVPFQSNSDELTMSADRAAVVLVENLLVDDRFVDASGPTMVVTDPSAVTPGIIDKSKFDDLVTNLGGIANVRKTLGLGYGTGSSDFYNLQIILELDKPLPNTYDISPDGDPSGSNVGQSKRFVYVPEENAPGDYTYTKAILTVRVW